jgi:MFS family permease
LNNLAVIVALVAGAIYAIGNFLGAFNNYDSRDVPALIRIFGVYVPIVLATIMVVTLILFAFVFRQDAPDLENTEKDEERAKLQRYIGLAYASPIIGTAIAVILGLVVYDTTRTNLDVWIWVVIQAIIATSIIIGTSFAAKVRLARPLEPRPKLRGIAAVNLNLVITIVFGVVVTIMSFTFGASAVDELREWPEYKPGMTEAIMPTVKPADLTWFISKMLPAITLLALAEFGIYRTLVVRNSKKDEIA